MGTIQSPINSSKGCGGVMRVAPVGLVFQGRKAFQIACQCAAITHGHPSGYISSGIFAYTFLILNLLISYKENEYKLFNLGMAPLSNVGKTQSAHSSEKIARLVAHYGRRFYSFDGLRNYKEKFDPKWEARYLAYEEMALLPSSLIEATILIHSK